MDSPSTVLAIGPIGLDQVVFVLMVIFALYTILARNLKRAILNSSIFGLWAALAYLLYHAPDVAVSEAVIASSIGTILYVLTIRYYDDLAVIRLGVISKRRTVDLLLVLVCGLTLVLSSWIPHRQLGPVELEVMYRYLDGPRVVNPVTSILLNYRVIDTIFESLLLVIAVLGVIHLTDSRSVIGVEGYQSFYRNHPTMRTAINILIPFMIIAGIALILGDPYTPGGGFQGGGLLVAVVISRYLIRTNDVVGIKQMESLEKVVFLIFVASVVLYIFIGWHDVVPGSYVPFMLSMNALLGLKVFCGLSLMFIYFVSEREAPKPRRNRTETATRSRRARAANRRSAAAATEVIESEATNELD